MSRKPQRKKKDIRENAIVVTCSQFFVDIDLIINKLNRMTTIFFATSSSLRPFLLQLHTISESETTVY